MGIHEFANGKIAFVGATPKANAHEADHCPFEQTYEMWVEAAESNLIDTRIELDDFRKRNLVLIENNNILFDQKELLENRVAEQEDEIRHLKELSGVEDEVRVGDKVWSKATGKGPFVVIATQEHLYGSQKLALESWLVRDAKGKDLELPKGEATRKAPPVSFVKLALTSALFWVLTAVCAGAFVTGAAASIANTVDPKATTRVEGKR